MIPIPFLKQREEGILVTGMALFALFSALTTWTRKYRRNPNYHLQLLSCLLSISANICMYIIATDNIETSLTGKFETRTTWAAFIAINSSDAQQYLLTYYMMLRILSILGPGRSAGSVWGVRMVLGSIVLLFFVDQVMSFVAMAQADLSVVTTLTYSYYFNKVGKTATAAGLLIYTVTVVIVDVCLLWKIQQSQRHLKHNMNMIPNQQANHQNDTMINTTRLASTQAGIILGSLAVKIAECAFKLMSVTHDYMALDSYLRGLSSAVEIWSLVELGVTADEIFKTKPVVVGANTVQVVGGDLEKWGSGMKDRGISGKGSD